MLPPVLESAMASVERCEGILLSGGDDPIMETWGRPTHPCAVRIDPARQAFDLAVLAAARATRTPILGVCLGMQLMGLEAGADLDQHLPDSCPSASMHADGAMHEVTGPLGTGLVHSRHHQALRSGGRFDVVGEASDGIVEAIRDPEAEFCVGVQWHPERTGEGPLGMGLFVSFIDAARSHRRVIA